MTSNDTPQSANIEQTESRSSTPETLENLEAISFGDEDDVDFDSHSDSGSLTQTESIEQSFHGTRDFSRIDEETEAEEEEEAEEAGGTDRESEDGEDNTDGDETASQASTVEPLSPSKSTTPIITRLSQASGSADEVIVPVLEQVAEQDAEQDHEIVDIDEKAPDGGLSDVHPPPLTASTSSLSDDKPTYPPSPSTRKNSLAGGTTSTLPVLATDPGNEPIHIPPDGGLRAWANVLGGFLILFASFGLVRAFGVFQAYFAEYRFTSRTESEISWIGSCQLCLFFLLALVAGPMCDKGRFRLLIGTGSVLWTLSVFLIPEAKTYGQCMFVQGILGGLAVGLLFVPSLSIQSHWFEKKRSLAIGLVASGTSVGGICFPIMLNKLIADPNIGFATAVRAAGAVVAICLLIANLIMSPHPARKTVTKPPPPPLKQIFTLPYACLVIGAFILNWGLWFPNFYVQLYFKQQGASENATYYALAIFNAGSFLGRVLPNIVADLAFGPFNMQVLCCLCSGIMIFLMRVMTSQAMLILWALLCGFFTGGFISLVSPVIVSVSDNNLAEVG
ncbi:hypothetical protein JCM10908_005792 [Rhodotorula pacifica]|uniref:uncharacterized protein n=1 Tax=Rhodotorula pacifica TaxID=1495444 RepID=UPI00317E84A8